MSGARPRLPALSQAFPAAPRVAGRTEPKVVKSRAWAPLPRWLPGVSPWLCQKGHRAGQPRDWWIRVSCPELWHPSWHHEGQF